MEISVSFKNVYGNWLCYPMDAKAASFAKIANNKTLTRNTLVNILAIGFRVNEVVNGRVVRTFVAGSGETLPAVA